MKLMWTERLNNHWIIYWRGIPIFKTYIVTNEDFITSIKQRGVTFDCW